MPDQPEDVDATRADEEPPLSSEAPDTVEAEESAPPADMPVQATEDPQELLAAAERPEGAAEVSGSAEEAPDGQVSEADDLLADASAVDPKIDIRLLEAYLFSTHSPLTPGRLAELFNLESTKPIRKAIRLLNEQYEQTARCFRVEQVAGGFQLLTLPDFGESLKALHQREQDAKLTKAALETLAIIAYKQPILRADLEAIRGVASGETIRSLMEKHLVKIAGRAEEPGRPILYGTTKRFLEVFGLNSLKDMPQPEGLPTKAQQKASALLAEPEEQTAGGGEVNPDAAVAELPLSGENAAPETAAAQPAATEPPVSGVDGEQNALPEGSDPGEPEKRAQTDGSPSSQNTEDKQP